MRDLNEKGAPIPRVGDRVLYRDGAGKVYPAIIVVVHDHETLDLSVFTGRTHSHLTSVPELNEARPVTVGCWFWRSDGVY